jgi:hypothetical protein
LRREKEGKDEEKEKKKGENEEAKKWEEGD